MCSGNEDNDNNSNDNNYGNYRIRFGASIN